MPKWILTSNQNTNAGATGSKVLVTSKKDLETRLAEAKRSGASVQVRDA